jgi:hypothetical protein
MLARNGDLPGVAKSMKQMEDRFNKRFRYPYVFLNEEPFSDQFKKCVHPHVAVVYFTPLTTIAALRQESDRTDRFDCRVWTYSSRSLAPARLDR